MAVSNEQIRTRAYRTGLADGLVLGATFAFTGAAVLVLLLLGRL